MACMWLAAAALDLSSLSFSFRFTSARTQHSVMHTAMCYTRTHQFVMNTQTHHNVNTHKRSNLLYAQHSVISAPICCTSPLVRCHQYFSPKTKRNKIQPHSTQHTQPSCMPLLELTFDRFLQLGSVLGAAFVLEALCDTNADKSAARPNIKRDERKTKHNA